MFSLKKGLESRGFPVLRLRQQLSLVPRRKLIKVSSRSHPDILICSGLSADRHELGPASTPPPHATTWSTPITPSPTSSIISSMLDGFQPVKTTVSGASGYRVKVSYPEHSHRQWLLTKSRADKTKVALSMLGLILSLVELVYHF
jgi:hypothetical protein